MLIGCTPSGSVVLLPAPFTGLTTAWGFVNAEFSATVGGEAGAGGAAAPVAPGVSCGVVTTFDAAAEAPFAGNAAETSTGWTMFMGAGPEVSSSPIGGAPVPATPEGLLEPAATAGAFEPAPVPAPPAAAGALDPATADAEAEAAADALAMAPAPAAAPGAPC